MRAKEAWATGVSASLRVGPTQATGYLPQFPRPTDCLRALDRASLPGPPMPDSLPGEWSLDPDPTQPHVVGLE